MNKYLEKIAEAPKKKYDSFAEGVRGGVYGGIGMGISGTAGALVGMTSLEETAANRVGKHSTLRKMYKDHGMTRKDVKFYPKGNHAESIGRSDPYFFGEKIRKLMFGKDSSGSRINAGPSRKNVGILAHELGHAVSYKKSKAPGLALAGYALGRPGIGLGAGALAMSNEKTKDYAPAVPAALAVPMLHEEFTANRHAYNAFKKHEGKHVANKFLKRMAAKNMISYLTPVAGTVAGLALAKRSINKRHKDDK